MDEKRVIPDGEPIPMSEFTLGERYGSAEMYRDFPHLAPGDRVSFEKDGVVYTDTVSSVNYASGEYAPPPRRSWWQKAVRAITPPRFRKPLPQATRTLGTTSVQVGVAGPDMQRLGTTLAEMRAAISKVI